MIATFHNHSTWSDGRASAADMYRFAWTAGVELFGLSDHLCVYPDRTSPDWSVAPSRMKDYIAEVRALRDVHGPEVVVGLEFDWFENHGQMIKPILADLDLDYRIGSVHHVARQQFDVDRSFWTEKSDDQRNEVYIAYWNLIREMAESALFDIAGHLDLPKKLGFYPSCDMEGPVGSALDAIKAHGVVVELNTAGFGKPCADGYPSLALLKQCRAREIPVTLSSDAHIPEHLLYEFERGLKVLSAAGYDRIARFTRRECWFEPLDDALRLKSH